MGVATSRQFKSYVTMASRWRPWLRVSARAYKSWSLCVALVPITVVNSFQLTGVMTAFATPAFRTMGSGDFESATAVGNPP